MPVIDASAYPHIVEAILSEPVAWRAARTLNRFWRDTVDEATSVVMVTGDRTDNFFLATTPTTRVPELRLNLLLDETLASGLGRLPPIVWLLTLTWIPEQPRTLLFNILGKVYTAYVVEDSFRWTHPCEALVTHGKVPLCGPTGVGKFVIIKLDWDELYPLQADCTVQDPFPLSVSQVTVLFRIDGNDHHQSMLSIDENIFIQLAQVLVSGRVLNIVDLVTSGPAHTQDWFTGKLRPQVEFQLLNPPLPAPLVTEPIDQVMGRLKFFDLDSYRQLNPGELW